MTNREDRDPALLELELRAAVQQLEEARAALGHIWEAMGHSGPVRPWTCAGAVLDYRAQIGISAEQAGREIALLRDALGKADAALVAALDASDGCSEMDAWADHVLPKARPSRALLEGWTAAVPDVVVAERER